ncbi:MAG: HD domain-containing protein [Hyphomicrobiales bacterium]
MSKPKFFRDPVHLQIRFEDIDLGGLCPSENPNAALSWSVRKVIDTPAFQRLRHIRQNGLANLVFHGAEHSRFSHSMGVLHLARRMYEKLCANSSRSYEDEWALQVAVAALVHDTGHGPFSHAIEDVLKGIDKKFKHETMTLRFIEEPDSSIHQVLVGVDGSLPGKISAFFDLKRRDNDHFAYKIVSSQMDADRLDYVQRDALFSGIRGHGFDIERLLDLIFVIDGKNIGVHRSAIEALEGYLTSLDQMWRAVYYHQGNRAASVMLNALLRRATELHLDGDISVFPDVRGRKHPLASLLENGDQISLEDYLRLTDATVWMLMDEWVEHGDFALSMLAQRILNRDLLKSIPIQSGKVKAAMELSKRAEEATKELFKECENAERYFYAFDEPSRTSYKSYDWKADAPDNSIWLTDGAGNDQPIEDYDESGIITALKDARQFDRIFVDGRVRAQLVEN